jgi:hypothetical protein
MEINKTTQHKHTLTNDKREQQALTISMIQLSLRPSVDEIGEAKHTEESKRIFDEYLRNCVKTPTTEHKNEG